MLPVAKIKINKRVVHVNVSTIFLPTVVTTILENSALDKFQVLNNKFKQNSAQLKQCDKKATKQKELFPTLLCSSQKPNSKSQCAINSVHTCIGAQPRASLLHVLEAHMY